MHEASGSTDLLTNFPLLGTTDISAAQRMTSQFWPAHTSETLGPEDYTVLMNRVLLGDVAITFVRCSARIRVVPSEPCQEAALILPLSGSVEIQTDCGIARATPKHPLLRGPGWLRRFEAAPSACVVLDLSVSALAAVASIGGIRLPEPIGCMSLIGKQALVRSRLLGFIRKINRNTRVRAMQQLAQVDRQRLLTASLKGEEHAVLEAIAASIESSTSENAAQPSLAVAASVEVWLAEQAFKGLSLAELARSAGTTTRAIQRACERAGFTPQAFIRSVRLDRARALLCDPSSATTVSDVALAVCIPHLGRFSEYYRERFGEQPSETLARARR